MSNTPTPHADASASPKPEELRALAIAMGISVHQRSSHGIKPAFDWGPKFGEGSNHFPSEAAAWRDADRYVEGRLVQAKKLWELRLEQLRASASPIDATDQQAVTVAQLQKLQDWLREPDHAEHFGTQQILEWINRRPTHIVPAALSRLASVSSASAEPPERKETLSERQAREVMNPSFGSAAGRSDGTAWNAATGNLHKTQNAPEPVPATNQAGEVDSIYGECPAHGRFARCVPCCALATQPATSQEGEGWPTEAMIDSGHAEWLKVQNGHPLAVQHKRVFLAMMAAAPPKEDRESGAWEENVEFLLAKCPHTIRGHEGGGPENLIVSLVLTFGKMQHMLAATPTPPTLSEDLRAVLVDSLAAELDGSYDCGRVWSAWSYGTMGEDDFSPITDRVDEIAGGIIAALDAALAQVKAS